MIELKTKNKRIATDGKNIFALFSDEAACDHCAARFRAGGCVMSTPLVHERALPDCRLLDDELDSYGTWKLVG